MNNIDEAITHKDVTKSIAGTWQNYLEYRTQMENQKGDEDRIILTVKYTPFEQSLTITERVKIITLTSNS